VSEAERLQSWESLNARRDAVIVCCIPQAAPVEHTKSDVRSPAAEAERRLATSERRLLRPRDALSSSSSATSTPVPAAAASHTIA